MKALLLSLSFLVSASGLAVESQVEKVIRASAKEETGISEAYDVYLSALSHQVIARTRVSFPMSLVKESSNYFIVERGYYISPNELRGFGLAIPKKPARSVHGKLKATDDLVLQSEERRQGLHTVVLTKRRVEPQHPADGSQPFRSLAVSNPVEAGSPR